MTGGCWSVPVPVSAFVNGYYAQTRTPVVAVSASRGSSKMHTWLKENGLFLDAGQRLDACLKYLNADPSYKIRHIYMVWIQGESDTSTKKTPEDYEEKLRNCLIILKNWGVEESFVIRIGLDLERDSEGIDHVIEAQTELCRTSEDFVLVSTQAVTLNDRGMMQDRMHYTQEGYNFIGEEAGANAGMLCGLMGWSPPWRIPTMEMNTCQGRKGNDSRCDHSGVPAGCQIKGMSSQAGSPDGEAHEDHPHEHGGALFRSFRDGWYFPYRGTPSDKGTI